MCVFTFLCVMRCSLVYMVESIFVDKLICLCVCMIVIDIKLTGTKKDSESAQTPQSCGC